MENKKERVLAYTKATMIEKESLAGIVGGDGETRGTTRQSVKVTGSHGAGIDVAYDVHPD
jgi:hypothetical protein